MPYRHTDKWDDMYGKAFAKRFDFDCVELRNLYRMSDQSNGRCPLDEYIIMYISFSVGRLCCSFRHPGNAKALHSGASEQQQLHVSFCACSERTRTTNQLLWGLAEILDLQQGESNVYHYYVYANL